MWLIRALAVVGFVLSAYAFHVEQELVHAQKMGLQYVALCDVGWFSCSKVFASEYGHASQFLGLPRVSNAISGMFFYTVAIAAITIAPKATFPLVFFMYAVSCVGSAVLACVLVFILNDICLVCMSIYIVNGISMARLVGKYRSGGAKKETKTAKKTK